MSRWLVVIVIIVVIAIVWYWQRERGRAAEQRRADDGRRLQEGTRSTGRAPLTETGATGVAVREGGTFQKAADAAAGVGLERATAQMHEATAGLAAARQEADLAAARLTAQADAALAAVQAAAAAHGGAVPGDGTPDCPPGFPVKGSMPARHYHEPGQLAYVRTIPEVCFQSAEAAEAAGFSPAQAESVLVEDVAVVEGDEEAGPEAAFAEALRGPERENGSQFDVVAEAIAAADAGGVPSGTIRGDGGRDCPPAYPIKGNQSSLLYHEPGSPTYQSTIPELCFSSVESAEAAGYAATRY
jgi:hypothetical protein